LVTTKKLEKIREKRKKRVKSKIFGTETKPRLAVFRSSKHIYVQAVADDIGRTLACASSLSKEVRDHVNGLKKTEAAREVGKLLAKELTAKNVSEAVFDRGKFLYHGRVKALAEGAREEGLKF
jgi:large subunit ribosomal protein L18